MKSKNWHQKHVDSYSLGDKIADKVAAGMGSWRFIIWQSIFVLLWMAANIIGYIRHWDAYPFILLNLIFSTQAAYAAPIIMMSQNRQSARDRIKAEEDYLVNQQAKEEIEALQKQLNKLEVEKLDKILALLTDLKK